MNIIYITHTGNAGKYEVTIGERHLATCDTLAQAEVLALREASFRGCPVDFSKI
jgi:hypothetical protein